MASPEKRGEGVDADRNDATGAVLVHLPAGWFMVGLGRNGMEYSVLLIVCLAVLGWVHAPAGQAKAPPADRRG